MEYSNLDEIYGNPAQIKTDGNNMNIPPPRDINKEQNFHFGSYQESAMQRNPEMANQSFSQTQKQSQIRTPDLNNREDIQSTIRRPEEDLASVISDANTVVIGGGRDNIGPIPGYASPRQFATIEETITKGLYEEQLDNRPVESSQEFESRSIFEQILEKMNELLTRVDYNEQEEKRGTYEILTHVGLYFLTGLFILYLLYYVFSLGKQNIKISLVK
jgi:hypothetical protein